jgi:NAD-dependent deacetylase
MDLIELLQKSRRTVVLTGAGMSTESGLKDFRSNGGLWAGKDPMEIASTRTIESVRKGEPFNSFIKRIGEFQDFYRWRVEEVMKHEPNEGHRILARWQEKGIIHRVITQNVDGYHQAAGSKDVITLHGDIRSFRCQHCKRTYTHEWYADNGPFCDYHDQLGVIRPNIVLFGEGLGDNIGEAFKEAKKADVIIAMGTSLNVSPANYIPMEGLQTNAKFVIINRDETAMDKYAHLLINDQDIGNVLQFLDNKLSSANKPTE